MWERWSQASLVWVPYLTLAISTVIALLRPDEAPGERLGTVAIAAAAGVWVNTIFTRAPSLVATTERGWRSTSSVCWR